MPGPGGVRVLAELLTEYVSLRFGRPLADHAETVSRISRQFTSDREDLSPAYLASPPARAAYLSYFAVTGAATVQAAMDLAGAWALLPKDRVRVLDIGAGPLSASLGIAAALPAGVQLDVTAIDGVRAVLEDGAQVLATLRPSAQCRYHAGNLREGRFLHAAAGGQHDLIIFANILNEWSVGARKSLSAGDFVAQVLERHLAPGGIALLVEPATREGSHAIIAAREHLQTALSLPILAPCMGAAQCPLAGSRKDWCFSERPWGRPDCIATLDRLMGHERTILKFSYLAVRNAVIEAPGPADQFRVIGGVMRDAGILRRYLCGQDGRRVAEVKQAYAPTVLFQSWRGDRIALPGKPQERGISGRPEPTWIPVPTDRPNEVPGPRPLPPRPRGAQAARGRPAGPPPRSTGGQEPPPRRGPPKRRDR